METIPYPDQARLRPLVGRPGWTQPHEVQALVWLSQKTQGVILEIGCNNGQTTLELASANPGRRIVACDYMGADDTMCVHQRSEGKPGAEHEIAQLARHLPNVMAINAKSETLDYAALAFPEELGLVFIDGDHTYAGVRKDTEKALDYFRDHPARDGARRFIVWHDYSDGHPAWVGVKQYLDEKIAPFYPIKAIEGTWLAVLEV